MSDGQIFKLEVQTLPSSLILGDFDRTAVELIYWLASRGATKIAFATHDNISKGYQSFNIQQWAANHVELSFFNYDCTNESGTYNLLQKANSLGPISGIFYLEQVRRM